MTVVAFITLLTIFSTVTGFVVEGVKKLFEALNVKYESNVIACAVGGVVGIGGSVAYYVVEGIAFSTGNIALMIVMGVASALGAMIGYDKIIQTVEQFKK